ncbi:MAG: FGGY-family carbohydrate kinase [Albidovulum sp.]|jgi:xylulokinase|uniref:FGGY-family carbohydrate kinase n=1 Tax=Albidovulum sp. TaxID=1872424 RepID=UPI003C9F9396
MTHTLGIDIGTFESKGVIVDQKGGIVATATSPHKMIVPQPGWAEHRAEEDWWHDFTVISRKLLADSGIDPRDIKAIATSAIGPCMLPVDADGAPLMNAVLYGVDSRAEAEIDALNARIGADRILQTCGNALTSQSVGPKILWLKNHRPEIFARTAMITTSTTYLVHKLTGEYVIDHYTAANFSPLYDASARDWTQDLAPDIIGTDRLPRLMWSTEIAGTLTSKAAAETGLAVGTPVTCGTIDAAAEAVSVGVQEPGDMMVMYGSTIFIIALTEGRVNDPRLWYAPWLFEGQHASMAGLSTSGTLTHWFRDQFARELPRETAFEALTAEAAAAPPGANGLLVLPYFMGERTPIYDARAKGTFFGLNLTHTRGDMFRALLEGIANGTAHVIETFRDTGQKATRILAVGGGVKNPVWLQATSDIAAVPQVISKESIGASYGDAYLAALAIGAAKPGGIAKWNPARTRIEPRALDVYTRQYALFKRLHTQTRDIAHALDGGS